MSTLMSRITHPLRGRKPAYAFIVTSVVLALAVVGVVWALGHPETSTSPGDTDTTTPGGSTTPPTTEHPPGPYQSNTNGQIMVVAYHAIGAKEGRWERTPAGLQADLQALYERGYRPVNLVDMVTGKMDVPKGYSPVVLTFDDGREGQFRYITGEDGQQKVDPESAVGVLLAFNKEHPEWRLRASFYVGDVPFQKADWPAKLRFLAENGMEIGVHTMSHVSLAKSSLETTIREIGGEVKRIAGAVHGYNASTLALPGGELPAHPDAAVKGVFEGTSYEMKGTVLVGAGPAPSPLSKTFNPQRIPRIQAVDPSLKVDYALPFWIDYFDRHPDLRYVSDGGSATK